MSEVAGSGYVLDDQVGYLLRLASQRHAALFQAAMEDGLTPTQFATLIRVAEQGEVSQNALGRLAAMDVATIKGVVDRLRGKGLVTSRPDAQDRRRSVITLTETGREMIGQLERLGADITEATLEPLTGPERRTLIALLRKIS